MNFDKDVLQASQKLPVLVDFWAPWCGPCHVLSPVIEEAEKAYAGKWKLVKINVDENPELANAYAVRSIPNVKLFSKGAVIAEFAGALPQHALMQWLEEKLPDPCIDSFENLESTLESVPSLDNVEKLKNFLDRCPGTEQAVLLLIRNLIFYSPEESRQFLQQTDFDGKNYDAAEDLGAILDFLDTDFDCEKAADEGFCKIQDAINDRDLSTAADLIVQMVQRDKTYRDELPRRLAVSFFHLLGDNHPISRNYRRLFDMALY